MSIPQKVYEFQAATISGVGPFNDPLSIYSKGHKVLSTNPINGIPDISTIVQNIDLLVGDKLLYRPEEPRVHNFSPVLTEDITIPPEYSGLTVALKFSTHTIKTTTNTFINL